MNDIYQLINLIEGKYKKLKNDYNELLRQQSNDGICDYNDNKNINIDDYNIIPTTSFMDDLNKTRYLILSSNKAVEINTEFKPGTNLKNYIRDIITNVITKDITSTKKHYFLIHIINKIAKIIFDEYGKLTGITPVLEYRGGNVLKIYKDNFEDLVSNKAKKILMDEFKGFFNYSDLDFYVCVNKKGMDEFPDKIFDDCLAMGYIILNYSRIFLMMNSDIFNLCNYNTEYINSEYDSLLNEINKEAENNFDQDVQFIS